MFEFVDMLEKILKTIKWMINKILRWNHKTLFKKV